MKRVLFLVIFGGIAFYAFTMDKREQYEEAIERDTLFCSNEDVLRGVFDIAASGDGAATAEAIEDSLSNGCSVLPAATQVFAVRDGNLGDFFRVFSSEVLTTLKVRTVGSTAYGYIDIKATISSASSSPLDQAL